MIAVLFATLVSTILAVPIGQTSLINASFVEGKWFDRLVIAVFENKHYNQVANLTNFSALEQRGVSLVKYYAKTHPSLPNYLTMLAGSDMGVKDDEMYDFDNKTIVNSLDDAGIEWLSVQEKYPTDQGCFTGKMKLSTNGDPGYYVSFTYVSKNEERCKKVVSEVVFDRMLGNQSTNRLPQFVFYTPDMYNDAHDTPAAYADTYLPSLLERLDKINDNLRTLFMITWDEDDFSEGPDSNHIHTVLYGHGIPKGIKDAVLYDHFSIPATIEANWGLATLGRKDETATTFKLDY